MQLDQLGIEGYLLAGKLVLMLDCPQLSVDLPSTVSCLLFLLVDLLLDGEELHAWLRCCGPHRDRQDGLDHRSVFRCWRGGDGDSQGYHVAPLGAGGFGAPPLRSRWCRPHRRNP
jgi:hypothetical protein